MANRSVSAELQLKAAQFKAEARESAKAVAGINDELAEVATHKAGFDEMERETAKLAVTAAEAAKQTDKLGDQSREAAADAHFLSTELAKTRREVEELGLAYALLGKEDDLKSLKKKTSDLRELESVSKQVSDQVAKSLAQGGEDGVQAIASSVEGGASSGGAVAGSLAMWGPLLLPVVAVVGAGLGGVLGGAIVAGVGTAGVGAGIAAAFTDQRVRVAARDAFTPVFAGIIADARDAFAAPTVAGLHEVAGAFEALRPKLRGVEAELAPLTNQLAHGIAEGVDRFGDHLTRALVDAKPLIEWAANEIPVVLDEIGGLLENLAEHADEERFALNVFFGAVKVGITVLEGLADAGSAIITPFEKLHDLVLGAPKAHKDAAGATKENAAAVGELARTVVAAVPSLDDLNKQLDQTAATADTLAGKMVDKVFGALLDADGATLHLAESQTRLSESFAQNGKSIDLHTAKGQANREAIRTVVQQNIESYDWMIKSGQGADVAAAAYDKNTAALERQLHKLGLTPAAIDEVIGKYRQVPDKVDTNIAIKGLTDAINDLNDLIRMLNGLPPLKTVTIHTKYVTTGVAVGVNGARATGGQLPHAAMGAFFPPTDPGIVIAEPQTHGEWMIPQAGISQQRAYDLGSAAMAPHGLAVGRPAMASVGASTGGTLRIVLSGADAATQAFVGGLRAYVQGSYGGDVQLALGQN